LLLIFADYSSVRGVFGGDCRPEREFSEQPSESADVSAVE